MQALLAGKPVPFSSTCLFDHPAPAGNLAVSVVVPVKDEADHLYNTLEALRLQQNQYGRELDPSLYEVLVLLNNCTDHSEVIAMEYQQAFPEFALLVETVQLQESEAHIGTARRLLMDEAYVRLMSVGKTNGIIASTDGDTEVDARWVFHIMEEIEKGNDAVGGRIFTKHPETRSKEYYERNDIFRNLVVRVESLIDPVAHDPWPAHFQYHGASLAVTCNMYERVGGLPRLPYLEDEAFYHSLFRVDARIRRSPQVKVTTSSRLEGRVKIGFSEQLKLWQDMTAQNNLQYAEAAEAIVAKFTYRKLLRNCWLNKSVCHGVDAAALALLANEWHIAPQWLKNEIECCRYFGQLWQTVEEKLRTGDGLSKRQAVPIGQSITSLEAFIQAWPCVKK